MKIYNLIKRIYHKCRLFVKLPFHIFRKNQVDKTAIIERNVYVRHCKIGRNSYIGMNGFYNNVIIGNYSSIAAFVVIGAMEHSHWALSTSTILSDEGKDDGKTYVGNDVWIGTNCVIRQGVRIGNGAVIGANSFVNKDIPPYAIAFGTPVKIYKYRFDDEMISKIEQSRYWELPPEEAIQVLNNIKNK